MLGGKVRTHRLTGRERESWGPGKGVRTNFYNRYTQR